MNQINTENKSQKHSYKSLSSRAKIGEKAVEILQSGEAIPDKLSFELIQEGIGMEAKNFIVVLNHFIKK